jgi:hypothetical protein
MTDAIPQMTIPQRLRHSNYAAEGARFQAADEIERLQDALDKTTSGEGSAQPERQKPIPYPHSAPGKVTPCLGFDGGSLHIYQQGYGERDGDGYFIFKDDELDWEQDDGTDYRIVKLHNSDILFIRDHLNRLFPPSEIGGKG